MDRDIDHELAQVDVNVVAPLRLTHAALQTMRRLNRGTILTISSLDAVVPIPFHITYSSRKAFLNIFAEGLRGELHGTQVTITNVMPGFVRTEFTQRSGLDAALERVPKILLLSPDQVARSALAAAGSRKALSVPGAMYRWYATLLRFVPHGLRRPIAMRIVPPEAITVRG